MVAGHLLIDNDHIAPRSHAKVDCLIDDTDQFPTMRAGEFNKIVVAYDPAP